MLGLPQYRVLKVKARRYGSTFRWEIREADGRIIETSSDAYSTDSEAIRAGNRAARAVRKKGAAYVWALDRRRSDLLIKSGRKIRIAKEAAN
jgi:uncharacterized protein YegP (UPF0339 family)